MKQASLFLSVVLSVVTFMSSGCATKFPQPDKTSLSLESSTTAQELLMRCVDAHGGDLLSEVNDVSLSIIGEWEGLITKIQPLVTDFEYRIESQERYLFSEEIKAVRWTGPKGQKVVLREDGQVKVYYNGTMSEAKDVLKSSALTSDAFALFHLGPSYLKKFGRTPIRLADVKEAGRDYNRIYFELTPGFGFSKRDEVVAYIDAETNRLYRVWITLEGYKTTRGATVDVTYNGYSEIEGYLFPSQMVERVRAPIRIKAHTWWLTGVDVNRGLNAADFKGENWSDHASKPADAL